MPRRSSTPKWTDFFFKPLQFHLQAADLLEEFLLTIQGRRRVELGFAAEHLRQTFGEFLLPLAHLHRVQSVPCRNGVHRLDALEGFERNFGFQFGTMLTTFLGHRDRSISGLDLTIPPVQFLGSISFSAWHKGASPAPHVSRDFALDGEPNAWLERFRINFNYTLSGLAKELRTSSDARTRRLHEVCKYWKEDPTVDFAAVMEGELRAITRQPMVEHSRFAAGIAAVRLGKIPAESFDLYPPPAASLVAHMLADLEDGTPGVEPRLNRIKDFFTSEAIRAVPFARISALFWATLARDVRSGRNPDKFPGSSMFNDIDVVAAYAPFCDAMFVDREISHLANQGELRRELAGMGRLFSVRSGEDLQFLDLLDQIEANASPEHLKLVAEVYGTGWDKPYWELLAHKQAGK